MTIDKQNPTHQRQQPRSLSNALLPLSSVGDMGSPVPIIPNSRRDPIEQRAFIRSIMEQAIEIANHIGPWFSEDSPSGNTDEEEEEKRRSQNQNQ
jgi:hypothetical protein